MNAGLSGPSVDNDRSVHFKNTTRPVIAASFDLAFSNKPPLSASFLYKKYAFAMDFVGGSAKADHLCVLVHGVRSAQGHHKKVP